MRPHFDLHELPQAYFTDNKESDELRKYIIKKQIGISECSQENLETIFFSQDNIDIINKQLIISVYHNTNNQVKILPQSNTSLIIVMRYVFIEYSKNLPFNILEQIKELNCRVINEILPNIITNIEQKITYLDSLDKPKQLLPLPEHVKNNKPLLHGFTR